MEEMANFFYRKKVMVTGQSGFKGTWLSMILKNMGAVVCGYSLPVEPDSFYIKAECKTDYQIEGDIADFYLLDKTIKEFQPEILIHLASHSSLDGCDEIPDYIFRTNIMGVVNVLECIRKTNKTKCVLIVTSDKCYKNTGMNAAYSEENILGGSDPYSVSKVCQELVSRCYWESFFEKVDSAPNIATARASNVIGPGDSNCTRLLPYLIEHFINGQPAIIRNKQSIRPWQYVLDVLWGYLLIVKKMYECTEKSVHGAYNFGPDHDGIITVEKLVDLLKKNFRDAKVTYVQNGSRKFPEANILKLDSQKAKNFLSWKHLYTIDEVLALTADFYKRNKQGESIHALCGEYVERYVERVSRQYQ